MEDDPEEYEFDDLGEYSWWSDAEGVTLVDDDEEEDDAPEGVEDEVVAFTCLDCGQQFRLNPKGCDKIYCYFCGEEAKRNPPKLIKSEDHVEQYPDWDEEDE